MFNFAQIFNVDSDSVQKAKKIGITKIDLFFYAKPKIEGNKSGIYSPGVEVFISNVQNNIPEVTPISDINQQPSIARREYSEINTSNDGSVPTTFTFFNPVNIDTDNSYSILIKYDGNEDFVLWESKKGDFIYGTTNICTGPSGKYVGSLFGYSGGGNTSNSYTPENWKPYVDQDLKFNVYCARYFNNGVPVANSLNTTQYISTNGSTVSVTSPTIPVELISFDKKISSFDNLLYGCLVYQTQPYFPGGYKTPATCSVSANTTSLISLNSFNYANGVAASWNNIFNPLASSQEYIVIKSLNHYGAGQHATAVRRVMTISTAGNELLLDSKIPFSNNAAYFYKAPVGRYAGLSKSYLYGSLTNLIVLTDSNANAATRFVNNSVIDYTINSGGTGYSNTDYIAVTGFENVVAECEGGYKATANIVTNANGTITSIIPANNGAGFVNGYVYTLLSNTNSNSSGSSANLTISIGANLYTDYGQEDIYFKGCKVINLEAAQVTPDISMVFPPGVDYSIKFSTLYYTTKSANTYSGKAYFVDNTARTVPIDLRNEHTENFTANTPVITSRSNQYSIRFANGAVANTTVVGNQFSNVAAYIIETTSNNDFCALTIKPKNINSYYGKYTINNDYTGEETNYGAAFSKHVTTKVNLDNDQKAEDLLVYVTAFRPVNTDIKVYARVHNNQDSDAFDDKDWTLLEQTGGIGVYSNPNNEKDMYEYTYNFSAYPNTEFTFAGTVTTTNNSVVITGSNTTLNSNLAVNDLVKIYSPLFPNTNYTIAVVNSITNSTSLSISTPVTNNSVIGSGFKIDKLMYKHQVFNNITNDNVARYYDSSMTEHDTFNTMQVKVVLLADQDQLVPKVDDIRAIACSA